MAFQAKEIAYRTLSRHRTFEIYARAIRKALKPFKFGKGGTPQMCERAAEGAMIKWEQEKNKALQLFRPHVCPVVGCHAVITTANLEKRHIGRCHPVEPALTKGYRQKGRDKAQIEALIKRKRADTAQEGGKVKEKDSDSTTTSVKRRKA